MSISRYLDWMTGASFARFSQIIMYSYHGLASLNTREAYILLLARSSLRSSLADRGYAPPSPTVASLPPLTFANAKNAPMDKMNGLMPQSEFSQACQKLFVVRTPVQQRP